MKFTLPWLKDYLDTSAGLPAILEAWIKHYGFKPWLLPTVMGG